MFYVVTRTAESGIGAANEATIFVGQALWRNIPQDTVTSKAVTRTTVSGIGAVSGWLSLGKLCGAIS